MDFAEEDICRSISSSNTFGLPVIVGDEFPVLSILLTGELSVSLIEYKLKLEVLLYTRLVQLSLCISTVSVDGTLYLHLLIQHVKQA